MLLVNNVALDALTPKTLTHADWSGAVHFADLVFPWFLLAVGVSLPFSYESVTAKGVSFARFLLKAVTRTVALVLLGWLVDSCVAHSVVIGLGVLQLIAISYLFAALFIRLSAGGRLLVAIVGMAIHWMILKVWPLPDGSVGTIAEGSNAIDHINDAYLSSLHLRGLLSVLTTGPLVLMGTILGSRLRRPEPHAWRFLLVAALSLVGIGLALSIQMPMNKPIWTSSYVLYSAGLGTLLLGFLYLVLDRGKLGWMAFPFLVFGSNAILAYIAPILFKTVILRNVPIEGGNLEDYLRQWPKDHLGVLAGGLVYTALYIAFWWMVLYLLYRRRWFLKV